MFVLATDHLTLGSGLLSTLQSRSRPSLPSTSSVEAALIVTFGTTEEGGAVQDWGGLSCQVMKPQPTEWRMG